MRSPFSADPTPSCARTSTALRSAVPSARTTNSVRANDYDGVLLKLDHKFSEQNSLAFRFNLLDSNTAGFLGGGGRASPASSTARNNHTFDYSFLASDTAMFGEHTVNE